jgi:toxin-antitoxin system PIN domain toxin
VPDANLLLYAYDANSPFHHRAVEWWEGCMNAEEPVGLCHAVLFAFIRLSTNPKVFDRPLSAAEAFDITDSWLANPLGCIIAPRDGHLGSVRALLESAGTAGNLVTDAQIAALALDFGATVHTADTDFSRFPGVSFVNPLLG